MTPAPKIPSLVAILRRLHILRCHFLRQDSGRDAEVLMRERKTVNNQGSPTTEPVTRTVKTYFPHLENVEVLMIHDVTINSTE